MYQPLQAMEIKENTRTNKNIQKATENGIHIEGKVKSPTKIMKNETEKKKLKMQK